MKNIAEEDTLFNNFEEETNQGTNYLSQDAKTDNSQNQHLAEKNKTFKYFYRLKGFMIQFHTFL